MAAEVHCHFQTWTSEGILVPTNAPGTVAVYRFDEGRGRLIHSVVGSAPDLHVPREFVLPQKSFLESPANEFSYDRGYAVSVAENIPGFMPLGFIFGACFAPGHSARQAILYAIAVGCALSLAVEVAQFYVPSRGSGITDVITNTAGAALGAFLACRQPTLDPRASVESIARSKTTPCRIAEGTPLGLVSVCGAKRITSVE